MIGIICWSLVVSLIINISMFLVAFKLQSDKLTDASYALSFITLALFAYVRSHKDVYALVATAMICFWALRIGSFLLYRVIHVGKDQRFDGIRDNFWRFGKFWLGQATTVWILMVPVSLALSNSQASHSAVVAGVGVWLIGFSLETAADLQKYRFTHDPAHKGRWIDSGLWRYSRHPNYFGEMLIWFGVYIYSFSHLSLGGKIVGAASPLLITTLLLFVSGIPLLEKGADAQWGHEPAYQAYKRRTSLLVPLPAKKSS